MSLQEFMAEHEVDLATCLGLVRDLADQGLVNDASGMGDPCAFLTAAGIRDVQERESRRNDPALRLATARKGLLRWFYEQDLADVHMPVTTKVLESDWSLHEGERLTDREVDRAAEFLAAHELIKGTRAWGSRGPIRAKITVKGQGCVEHYGGDVAEYLRDQRSAPAINTHIGTINSSGALAVGSTGVTQNVTTSADPAALASFAKTLLAELPNLPLPASAVDQARESLTEVVEAGDDTSRATGAFGRAVGYLIEAGKPVVTAAFLALAQHYGLPPA
ncbi:hypothetical protein [Micromonospora zamorensis]|uniref:hypothetical protein n=1 Tax=Micromonospora zamorensis TaxID=709883 RepID=UPI003CEB76E1